MTRRERRKWPWLVVGCIGVASFALGIAGAPAQEAAAVINGLDAVAFSDGVGQTFGDPNAQPYPVGKGDAAHTEATIFTGPTGYALASTVWPGPLAANAGSLAVLLGAPNEAGQANYRGRAEAYGNGPNDAEAPGMTAHAKGGEAEAVAGAQNFESAQGQSTGDVRTRSRSSFEAGSLRAVSSCNASDLGFGEGAVTVGSVRTEAEAVTNGTTSDAGGRTVVTGTKIGGQDAEVDENGVRFTDPATAPIGEQILANFGITMFVAAPRHEVGTSSASHRSGSLVVIWNPPGQTDTNYGYIYEICGSDAAVEVRTGLAYVAPPEIELPPSISEPISEFTTVDPVFEPTIEPTYTPGSPTTPTTPAVRPTLTTDPIAFVRTLSIWPYILGALCVLASGFGLGRAREAALVPRSAGVACPLEGARS
ncbi:MAG: hypothetical protein ACT452_07180 [Microthrixaceae bacterium]